MKRHYLSPSKEAAKAAEAAVFSKFRERIRASDPDAIADDGSIIGRNAATGELEPNATRTTGWAGEPQAVVQGYVIPVPEEDDLRLDAPADVGVEEAAFINPWPAPNPGGELAELPEWVQPRNASEVYPIGAWVQHLGMAYCSVLSGNSQEPQWPSLFWEAIPEPVAPDWVKPTGYQNVYPLDSIVTHNGRRWVSLIAANNEEPGADPTNRYWGVTGSDGPTEWSQPMPGGRRPYAKGEKALKDGKTWLNEAPLNVWVPGEEHSGWVVCP